MQATIPHRRGNRRVITALTLAAVLVAAPLGSTAWAGSAREQLEQIRERQAQISRQAAQQRALLARLEAEARSAAEAYARAQREEEEANRQLAGVTAALSQAQAALREAEAELDRVSRQLKARQQVLGDRLRSFYVYGEVQYLEVLMGATSFDDFLSRLDFLQLLAERDAQIVQDVQTAQAQVAVRRLEAEQRRNELQALEEQRRKQYEEAAAKTAAAARYRQQLSQREAALRQALDEFEREGQELARKARELEQQVGRELGRLVLSYPVQQPARITDGFGWRLHPILKTRRFHAGVDFAVRVGQPIYAAADGKVLFAGWQNGYGNVVIIGHGKVQGKSVATLYSHNSALTVRVGKEVKRGDVVALGGSTGLATGPNVHFEVIVDGKQVDPMGWLPK